MQSSLYRNISIYRVFTCLELPTVSSSGWIYLLIPEKHSSSLLRVCSLLSSLWPGVFYRLNNCRWLSYQVTRRSKPWKLCQYWYRSCNINNGKIKCWVSEGVTRSILSESRLTSWYTVSQPHHDVGYQELCFYHVGNRTRVYRVASDNVNYLATVPQHHVSW